MAEILPFDEQGAGEAVLLLHAGVADRSMWREHLGWLAQAGFHAIAVDLPGFGEAAVQTGAHAPWQDVLRTLQELQVEGATLVGNSFGAAVALRVATVAPAAVSALVLISPPRLGTEEVSEQLQTAWEQEEAALERGDIDTAINAVVDAWTQPDAPQALRERIAAMQRRAFELQAAATGVEEAPDPLEQRPELLAELQIPTLAAAGEHDMPDFKAAARELAEVMPQCEFAAIAGAGHLAPLDAPEAFRELVSNFLRAHGE
jgi:pimeloyl-ACP methyl ester carboxylesterase